MQKDDLRAVFEALAPTEEQKNRVFARVMAQDKKRQRGKLLSLSLAVGLLFALTAFSALAVSLDWHHKLASLFQPTPAQVEYMQGAVAQPLVTASDNGVTVQVMQTITERHGIWLLLEVTAPEGTELPENAAWESSVLRAYLTAPEDNAPAHVSVWNMRTLAVSGNKMTCLGHLRTESQIDGVQNLELLLDNLGFWADDDSASFQALRECAFDMEWALAYQDLTTVLTPEQPLLLNGRAARLASVEITPMSVFVEIVCEDGAAADGLPQFAEPVLELADGARLTMSLANTGSHFCTIGDDGATIGYFFDKVTDAAELQNLIIGDLVIPLHEE